MQDIAEWTALSTQYVGSLGSLMAKVVAGGDCAPSQFMRRLFGSSEGPLDEAAYSWALPLRCDVDEAVETLQVSWSVELCACECL